MAQATDDEALIAVVQRRVEQWLHADDSASAVLAMLEASGVDFVFQFAEDDDRLTWLRIASDVCIECGLPNISDGAFINQAQFVQLAIFCMDCTRDVSARARERLRSVS